MENQEVEKGGAETTCEVRKAPYLRCHLSAIPTLVVLLFLGLAFVNSVVVTGGIRSEHALSFLPKDDDGLPPMYNGAQGWPLSFREIYEWGDDSPPFGLWYPISLLGDIAIAGLVIATFAACLKALRPEGVGCHFYLSELITVCLACGVILLLNFRGDSRYGFLTTYGWPLRHAWGIFREQHDTVLSFSEGRFILGKVTILGRTFVANVILCGTSVTVIVVLVERILPKLMSFWRSRKIR